MKRFNLLAIVVMVALASASQAQQYRVADLGTLGGSFSGAASVNNRGVIAGFSTLSGDVQSNAVTCQRTWRTASPRMRFCSPRR